MFEHDILKRIEKDFGALAPSAIGELEKFIDSFQIMCGAHPGDRIIRCVVQLAEGKLENLRHYLNAALADPRDVIFWAEYDRNERRIYDFSMPFSNIL